MKIIKLLILSVYLFPILTANGQDRFFIQKFNNVLDTNSFYNSKSRIKNYSSDGNAKHFILLGYFVNANNIMFEATKNSSYLNNTLEVINNLKKTGLKMNKGNVNYQWIAKIKPTESNYNKNNKEFMLYEGYLFRYIAEYYYLVKMNQKGLNPRIHTVDLDFLKRNFFKWFNHSKAMYGDDSSLQSLRTHMGSHWATIAMYLYVLDDNKVDKEIYKRIFTKFNGSLRTNMNLISVNGNMAYQWNSTWDKPFTKYLAGKNAVRKERSEIQDVAHGNHVVQYILDSYKLGLGDWGSKDIQYLSNTLKYIIWDKSKSKFSDNIDGTDLRGSYNSSGWKQSDGWMKLMVFDPALYNIYKVFYEENKRKIDNSSLNLQFYANFVRFESKH